MGAGDEIDALEMFLDANGFRTRPVQFASRHFGFLDEGRAFFKVHGKTGFFIASAVPGTPDIRAIQPMPATQTLVAVPIVGGF